MNQITFIRKKSISQEIIHESFPHLDENELSISHIEDDGSFDNFTGDEIATVVISIVLNIASSSIYDLLKNGIMKLFEISKKLNRNNESDVFIKLMFTTKKETKIEIQFPPNTPSSAIIDAIDILEKKVQSDTKSNDKFYLDKETQIWKPAASLNSEDLNKLFKDLDNIFTS